MSMRCMQFEMKVLRGRMDLSQLAAYQYPKKTESDLLVQKTYRAIMSNSKELEVDGVQFPANSFDQFCKALEYEKKHPTLKMSRVTVEGITRGEMVGKVISALSKQDSIYKLSFTNCRIDDSDITPLVESIKKNKLQLPSIFSLANNEICGMQAYYLANTIKKGHSILDLSHNYLDDESVTRIKELKKSGFILKGNPDAIYSNNHDLKRAV